MRGIFLSFIFFMFLIYGIRAPFVFMLGYMWIDIFTPQFIAFNIISQIPVSMVMGVALLIFVPFQAKLGGANSSFLTFITCVFAVWMTITLSWSEVPESAYLKWNWAIKTVVISCFIPFFLKSRSQIEAGLWVILLSGMGHCIPAAAKVILSGGGYGRTLGLLSGNSGLAEGSTLALFSVFLIPIALYLLKHTTLLPQNAYFKVLMVGFIVAALLTSLGTFARTGLVSVAILGISLLLETKRKFTYLTFASIAIAVVIPFMGGVWSERMATINDGAEASSMGRVALWMWTIDYVFKHPLGGGFAMYQISDYVYTLSNGGLLHIKGKAFHSIYFEVLGETGFPGLFMYLSLVLGIIYIYTRMKRACVDKESHWIGELSSYLRISLFIFLVGGSFVGIAFQFYIFYLAAFATALWNLYKMAATK